MTTPADLLAQVAQDIRACTLCDLCQGARQGVPGTGPDRAKIMLIGEAPSQFDDRRGYPFSGPSGDFLDELLAAAGLQRSQVYLTNIVKHRVPQSRPLTPDEISACAPYLTREIAAVDPILIVALGSGAIRRFLPKAKISQIHGAHSLLQGRVVLAMYNPAAALHREELRETVVHDFTYALPAAFTEAQRLAAEGKLGESDGGSPEQLTLF
jgi:uracil-DNA glycosylase